MPISKPLLAIVSHRKHHLAVEQLPIRWQLLRGFNDANLNLTL